MRCNHWTSPVSSRLKIFFEKKKDLAMPTKNYLELDKVTLGGQGFVIVFEKKIKKSRFRVYGFGH